MKKRILFPWLAALMLFLATAYIERAQSSADGMAYYARLWEEALSMRISQARTLMADTLQIRRLIKNPAESLPSGLSLFAFQADSLVYWSNVDTPLPKLFSGRSDLSVQQLTDGFYAVIQGEFAGGAILVSLPMFRFSPVFSAAQPDYFPLYPAFPRGTLFSLTKPGVAVKSPEGRVLGYVEAQGPLPHPLLHRLALVFFFLGAAFWIVGMENLGRQTPLWQALLILAGASLGLGQLSRILFPLPDRSSEIIKELGEHPFLGYLLTVLLFSYWAGYHLIKRRNAAQVVPLGLGRRLATAGVLYLLILLGLGVFTRLVRQLVLFSDLMFEMDNLFNLSAQAFMILAGVLAMLPPLFFLSETAVSYIHQLGLDLKHRLASTVLAILLLLLPARMLLPEMEVLQVFLTGLIYLVLLDLYIDYRRQSLTWLIIWLVLFSAWSAALLYQFYQIREEMELLAEHVQGGYARPLSLFSFLFVLLLLIVLLASGVETLIGERKRRTSSLRFRLQLTVTTLIGGAFVFVGLVTVNSLRQSARLEQNERLREKISMVLLELSPGDTAYDPAELALRLAERHGVAVAFYDSGGKRSGASDEELLTSGLLPLRLEMALLRRAGQAEAPLWLGIARVGRRQFNRAYVVTGLPLREFRYLGLSLPAGEGSLNRAVYAFIGTLINIYVFLLLAASVVAIAVANSIARPLDYIGEKLQALGLGRNEPLEWKGDDEIGQLIQAYNEMIVKLEASAERLRQSEREGAWREMAKQVAHEIKNPLTPMKLSIQHLERAYQTDPERAVQLVKGVSRTLVEQIDGLSRIANEFSSFAQMPRAENQYISINDILGSIYQLFRENPEKEVQMELELPEEHLLVFADRTHLIRVLNNLVKNALQALSEDRPGQIVLSLWRKDQSAVIRVRDNGVGIPEELRAKVFYPNFTTKNSGMGLGLAMCRNILEQAGGRIYFETVLGEGTDFYVELPLADEEIRKD